MPQVGQLLVSGGWRRCQQVLEQYFEVVVRYAFTRYDLPQMVQVFVIIGGLYHSNEMSASMERLTGMGLEARVVE